MPRAARQTAKSVAACSMEVAAIPVASARLADVGLYVAVHVEGEPVTATARA